MRRSGTPGVRLHRRQIVFQSWSIRDRWGWQRRWWRWRRQVIHLIVKWQRIVVEVRRCRMKTRRDVGRQSMWNRGSIGYRRHLWRLLRLQSNEPFFQFDELSYLLKRDREVLDEWWQENVSVLYFLVEIDSFVGFGQSVFEWFERVDVFVDQAIATEEKDHPSMVKHHWSSSTYLSKVVLIFMRTSAISALASVNDCRMLSWARQFCLMMFSSSPCFFICSANKV